MKKAEAWMAAACAALCLALGAPLIPLGGLGHDEGWHAETALCLVGACAEPGLEYYRPAWPLMRDGYNGALKSYVLAAPFAVFGPSVTALRATTLALAAASVFVFALIGFLLLPRPVAGCFGAVLAADPALVLAGCYDTGPAILSLLLKASGLLLLLRGRPGAAGFAWGLAVWDKTHFVWFIAAAALSAVLLYGEPLRRRGRDAARLAVGLAAGALPLLAFNALRPLATLRTGHLGSWSEHLGRLPEIAAGRLLAMTQAFDAGGQWISGLPAPEWPPALLPACLLALGAAAWAACRRRGRLEPLRLPAFFALTTALVFAAAVLSPLPVKWHHFYAAYPLPQLAAASAVALLPAAWTRLPTAVLLLAAAAWAGRGAYLLDVRFRAEMEATGGMKGHFHRTATATARWLEARHRASPADRFFVDGDLRGRLWVLTGGGVPMTELSAARVSRGAVLLAEGAAWLRDVEEAFDRPGGGSTFAVVEIRKRELPSWSEATWLGELSAAGTLAEKVFDVPHQDGTPWTAIYRLEPMYNRGP